MGVLGDASEREADRVADAVARGDKVPAIVNTPSLAPLPQTKRERNRTVMPLEALVASSLRGELERSGGVPLPTATRSDMETAFGRDFSGIRVHADARAADLSQQLGAHAFTHGQHIYFNHGHYRPTSAVGRRLLAHELTHTIQQSASGARAAVQRDPDSVFFRYRSTSAFMLSVRHRGAIEQGTMQMYRVEMRSLPFPASQLSFQWRVFDADSDRLVHAPTLTSPHLYLRASQLGRFVVGVAIFRNGALLTQHMDGMPLRINQRVVRPRSQAQPQPRARNVRGQHTMPRCNGPVTQLDRVRSVDFAAVDNPAIDCSFTPLFHVHGRSVRISARASRPPSPAGAWSITTFECPVRLTNAQACERVFGTSRLVHGSTSQSLQYHYDPIAWTSRNIFVRIRNGATAPLRDVRVTFTPNIRDPLLQTIHDALAIAGMLPGVGIVADGLDVLIYVAEGDWGEAIVSAAAMVPAFGDAATVTRLGSRDIIRVSRSQIGEFDARELARRIERQRDLVRRTPTRRPARPRRSVSAARLNREQRQLRRVARTESGIRQVTDPELVRRGYQVEIRLGGGVIYRRRVGGIWCRFNSPEDCGLWIGDWVERRALAAIAGSEGPGGISITTNPRRLEQRPTLRSRAEGQVLPPLAGPAVRRVRRFEAGRRALRRRLEAANMGYPGYDWEAHHIIPWEFRQHPMILELRAHGGWDHNRHHNGIALPMEEIPGAQALPMHRDPGQRFHELYNGRVWTELEQIRNRWQNTNLERTERIMSHARLRREMNALIVRLRREFHSGRYRTLR